MLLQGFLDTGLRHGTYRLTGIRLHHLSIHASYEGQEDIANPLHRMPLRLVALDFGLACRS